MSVLNELGEVEDAQNKLKNMADNILDAYNKNPEKCGELLTEINSINKELDYLQKEFSKLQNEIY
jgi:peptidoglycan hydrolase CwlO-like protein